jgi:hypothetical protein
MHKPLAPGAEAAACRARACCVCVQRAGEGRPREMPPRPPTLQPKPNHLRTWEDARLLLLCGFHFSP